VMAQSMPPWQLKLNEVDHRQNPRQTDPAGR
jgi:hypothetical protein